MDRRKAYYKGKYFVQEITLLFICVSVYFIFN